MRVAVLGLGRMGSAKDVRLARSLGSGVNLDLVVTAAVETLLDRAIEGGLADRDIGAIVEGVRSPNRRTRRA